MGRSMVEFDLVWVDDGRGEADLRILDNDLWWPKVERPFDGGWCDQPVTATNLRPSALATAILCNASMRPSATARNGRRDFPSSRPVGCKPGEPANARGRRSCDCIIEIDSKIGGHTGNPAWRSGGGPHQRLAGPRNKQAIPVVTPSSGFGAV
jgi:hypothetical protein